MKYAEQLLKRTETAARRASHVVVEEGDILRCEHYLEELREAAGAVLALDMDSGPDAGSVMTVSVPLIV